MLVLLVLLCGEEDDLGDVGAPAPAPAGADATDKDILLVSLLSWWYESKELTE